MERIASARILEGFPLCATFQALFQSVSSTGSKHFLHYCPLKANHPLLKVRGAITQWQANRGKVKFCTRTYRYVCAYCIYIYSHIYLYTHVCMYMRAIQYLGYTHTHRVECLNFHPGSNADYLCSLEQIIHPPLRLSLWSLRWGPQCQSCNSRDSL